MQPKTPLVSVVIPTRDRQDLVIRAVQSVLQQTMQDLEILVVIDGDEPDTERGLSAIGDQRLRVISLAQSEGAPVARNRGVAEACGHWIALLDDDDEWLPRKLEVQLKLADASLFEYPILSSRFIARTPLADYVWPRQPPTPEVPLSEYLMVPGGAAACMQTSTIMAKREFFRRVPFRAGLKRHQDWDWILRAMATPGAGIEFADESLSIYYTRDQRSTISNQRIDWKDLMAWAESVRPLLTDRAFRSFLVVRVGKTAAVAGKWRAFPTILRRACPNGFPEIRLIAIDFSFWVIPPSLRQRIRRALASLASGKVG